MRFKLLFILILSTAFCFAQKVKKEKVRKIKDTVCFEEYNSHIIVDYEGETKGYDLKIEQYFISDPEQQQQLFKPAPPPPKSQARYRAETQWSHGAGFAFDKIGFSFGIGSIEQTASDKIKKGKTDFLSFGLSVGGNKWILEAVYRHYKGFYDYYTSTNDNSYYNTTLKFHQLPNLVCDLYKLKFLYFTNHKKFAFKNCYSNSYRQIKTAASWVLTANAYYNILSCDSSLIPSSIRNYYGDFANLNGINVFGFSVYAGFSANLVIWKHLIWNTTLLFGPEDQCRTYARVGLPERYLNYVWLSGDFRSSIGLNYKNFFTFLSGTYDVTALPGNKISLTTDNYVVSFTLGFRIHVKYPKFYQKLQATKLYQLL